MAAARSVTRCIAILCGAMMAVAAQAAFASTTDLDGDGRSDVLWRNAQTGQVFRLAVNGTSVVGGGFVHSEPDTRWKIVADGDFNGDGRSDLVWRHDADGRIHVMLMGAGGVPAGGGVVHVEPDMRWHLVSTADVDNDGRADLVWWNETSGQVYAMALATTGAAVAWSGTVHVEPDTDWRIVGGSDGILLWRNQATGHVYRQQVVRTGGNWSASGAVVYREPNIAWAIIGVGDLNGDGSPDLVWRNGSTGQVYAMLLGATVIGGGTLHVEPNADWQIVALGDYDGDGRGDLLWRNFRTGQVFMMRVSGASVTASGHVYAEPEQHWRILGAHDYSWDDRLQGDYRQDAMRNFPAAFTLEPSCSGSPAINCPGGVPTPTSLTTTVLESSLTGDNFRAVVAVQGSFVANLPLAGNCTVTVNSAAGSSLSWTYTGTFVTGNTWGGSFPRNYLSGANVALTQAETADFSISGNFSCALANMGISFLIDTMTDALTDAVRFCGAPGPQAFMPCP
jgi:hypothetical protein